jgi:exodeoxyribonuclease VII small subunit
MSDNILHGADTDTAGDDNALGPRLRRLEKILSRLEREELELEDALALFEQGVVELRAAQTVIARTELRVDRLLRDEAGVIREPLPDETP